MGTLFIQEAFSCVWTPIIYIIGFVALWFHMNHGFWSMFQSIGWNNNTWLPRLKTIACWWTSIVVGLFIIQAIVFSINAHNNFYKTDASLREQYKNVMGDMVGIPVDRYKYDNFSSALRNQEQQLKAVLENPSQMMQMGFTPEMIQAELDNIAPAMEFLNYLEGENAAQEATPMVQPEN